MAYTNLLNQAYSQSFFMMTQYNAAKYQHQPSEESVSANTRSNALLFTDYRQQMNDQLKQTQPFTHALLRQNIDSFRKEALSPVSIPKTTVITPKVTSPKATSPKATSPKLVIPKPILTPTFIAQPPPPLKITPAEQTSDLTKKPKKKSEVLRRGGGVIDKTKKVEPKTEPQLSLIDEPLCTKTEIALLYQTQ
ncbi:ORF82 [white sturgeon herpesvirus 2]|uniref:ORF83 n=1 Tax=white sturgeon herpesvirus 2 TaxID=320884 RepID=F6GQ80_9VIRU|nr:ORF82 [Acipenserid herpesvirus 2]AEF97700.1 ORF82 [Acipenserid herpesvirus 2]